MISVRRLLQWPTSSHEGALSNAREAAVLASRARVERVEVEAFLDAHLSAHAAHITDRPAGAGAAAR